MSDVSTFITPLGVCGPGPRLAVKDVIDVAGVPTTAGSLAYAETAGIPGADAECVARARCAGAQIIGKANLVELALGAHGINPWFGTPENPLGPGLSPGGSSSGSAVAVAAGEAEVSYGTDTGGSIRIPSACCGIAGLKPTHGRWSLAGVVPLAPSLDTVGPMAATVTGLIAAVQWLEPGFEAAPAPPGRILLMTDGAKRVISGAVVRALLQSGLIAETVALPGWGRAWRAGSVLLEAEAARCHPHLLAMAGRLDPPVAARLIRGAGYSSATVRAAESIRRSWTRELTALLKGDSLLALPTLRMLPPRLGDAPGCCFNWFTLPVNLAGLPAVAIPVPLPGSLPASLQLVGPANSEASLLRTALQVERALAS